MSQGHSTPRELAAGDGRQDLNIVEGFDFLMIKPESQSQDS